MAALHAQSQPACDSQAHHEPDQTMEQRCRQNACRLPAPICSSAAGAAMQPLTGTNPKLLACVQGSNPDISRHFIKPKQAERSLLRLITSQPARTLPELALQAAPGQELTCWASLVAGSGSLQTTMQRTRALPFRCTAFCCVQGPGFAVGSGDRTPGPVYRYRVPWWQGLGLGSLQPAAQPALQALRGLRGA